MTYFEGMGLCPIAPPKGFPIALWKPSVTNACFFKCSVYSDSLFP